MIPPCNAQGYLDWILCKNCLWACYLFFTLFCLVEHACLDCIYRLLSSRVFNKCHTSGSHHYLNRFPNLYWRVDTDIPVCILRALPSLHPSPKTASSGLGLSVDVLGLSHHQYQAYTGRFSFFQIWCMVRHLCWKYRMHSPLHYQNRLNVTWAFPPQTVDSLYHPLPAVLLPVVMVGS